MEFRASKPKRSILQWCSLIGWRIVFPPLLLWDACKLFFNYTMGRYIGSLVLPAQDFFADLKFDYQYQQGSKALAVQTDKHQVITHDGAALETFTISPLALKKVPTANKKYIIEFLANCRLAQHAFMHLAEDAIRLQAEVMVFNYRGVGGSSGRATSAQDLVTDGLAQIEFLLSQGVQAENIILSGHSIGGAVASLVAQRCHEQANKVKVFSDRSFATITRVVVGVVRSLRFRGAMTGHATSLLGRFLGFIVGPLVKLVLVLSQWEMPAAEAFKKIPPHYREYVFARSAATERRAEKPALDDTIITHYASVHTAMRGERRLLKSDLKKALGLSRQLKTQDARISSAMETAVKAYVEAKEQMRARKLRVNMERLIADRRAYFAEIYREKYPWFAAPEANWNPGQREDAEQIKNFIERGVQKYQEKLLKEGCCGHNLSLTCLLGRNGRAGTELFDAFVNGPGLFVAKSKDAPLGSVSMDASSESAQGDEVRIVIPSAS